LAILLSFLLSPLVTRCQKDRPRRVASVVLVVMLSFSFIGFVGWVVSQQAIEWPSSCRNTKVMFSTDSRHQDARRKSDGRGDEGGHRPSQELEQIPATTQATRPSRARPRVRVEEQTAIKPMPVQVVEGPPSTFQFVRNAFIPLFGPLANTAIVIVLVVFILLERENLRDRMIRLIGYGQLQLTTQAIDDAATRISRYLLMQMMINGTYGVCIALWTVGIGATIGDKPFPTSCWGSTLCSAAIHSLPRRMDRRGVSGRSLAARLHGSGVLISRCRAFHPDRTADQQPCWSHGCTAAARGFRR